MRRVGILLVLLALCPAILFAQQTPKQRLEALKAKFISIGSSVSAAEKTELLGLFDQAIAAQPDQLTDILGKLDALLALHPTVPVPPPTPTPVPPPTPPPVPTPPPTPPSSTQSTVLDAFTSLRVVQPNEPDIRQRFLWSLYSVQNHALDIVAVDGVQALRSVYPGGSNWQLALHTYTEQAPGFPSNGWQYTKAFTASPWVNNTYNRLRFRIKLPPGIFPRTGGASNFEVGTFIRKTTDPITNQESDNRHYYHFYNFKTTGAWETVIVDMHPNAQRQSANECSAPSGSGECGVLAYPTGEAGFNYFDLLTHFYLDFPYNTGAGFPVPATFLVSGVEFYKETNVENEDQVYSLHASLTTSGQLSLGWQHKKFESSSHEVRYAWSSIHASGWNAATPLATVPAPNTGGYNGMDYNGSVPIAGHSGGTLYLAIKPVGTTLFRQIAVLVP